MSKFRQVDIFVELIDLCHEGIDEIRQQLAYYRASVYKDETATQIRGRIDQLRAIAGIFLDDGLNDAFKDYDIMSRAGVMNYVPGECSFSTRVTCLLTAMENGLGHISQQIANRSLKPTSDNEVTNNLRKHRREVLALCRHGSRQWMFFQSL